MANTRFSFLVQSTILAALLMYVSHCSVHVLTMHMFLFFFFLVCFAYSSSTSMAFTYFFVALHSSISHLHRKSRTLHLISSLPFSHGCVSFKKRYSWVICSSIMINPKIPDPVCRCGHL